jgi:ribonuclease-3
LSIIRAGLNISSHRVGDLPMNIRQPEEHESLQEKIGHSFGRPGLLRESLTHRSFSNEQPGKDFPHNERLEFLGDAVLDLVISHLVYRSFPRLPEGELTRIRAEVVSEKALAELARSLALGCCLRLGRGEDRSGGRDKDSLLADAFEAVLGAVFLDGGFEAARGVVERLFADGVAHSARRKVGVDHKTRLQEILQARHGKTPEYVLLQAEGPDHQRIYSVEARFEGEAIGSGRGRTKKKAEQEAAREALSGLGE